MKDFIEHEVEKVSGYANYDQYGGYGYRVRAIPSPLEVFFKSQTEVHESKVDTQEIIDIISSKRGKNSIRIYFEGFAGFVFFWGGLLQLYLGLTVFKSRKNLKIHIKIKTAWQTIIVRFALSVGFFIILFSLAYSLALIFLSLNQSDLKGFITFTIIFLTAMSLFFLIGLLIFFVGQKGMKHLKYAVIIWAFLVLVPEFINGILDSDTGQIPSMYKMNVAKLRLEKKANIAASKKILEQLAENKKSKDEIYKTEIPKYVNSYYEKNKAMENDFITIEKINAYRKEMISSFIPTYNYFFQTNEIIGGYNSYFEFLAHVLKTKERFLKWYYQKKFFERSKTIEPFAGGNEYVFEMKPVIPNFFLRSLMLSIGIAFTLLSWIHFYLRKFFKTHNANIPQYLPGFHFKMVEPETEREHFIAQYHGKKIIAIDNIGTPDFDRDIGVKTFVNWLIHLRNVNPTEVKEKLEVFELTTEGNQKISGDDIKRVYLSVMLSSADSCIINNIGKHMGHKFEKQFLDVLANLCLKEKIILYLGSEPLEGRRKKAFFDTRQNQDFVPIDINKISLR